MGRPITLESQLKGYARPGKYFDALPEHKVRCWACGHKCVIAPGRSGICMVRFNADGVLMVPSDYVIALNADPVEKKPFYHVVPGSRALSFGMLGCDLHCDFCQNWDISQALRDPDAGGVPQSITAEEIVRAAVNSGSRTVVSTYNEPLITSEWAVEIFQPAKEKGFLTGYVSNGHASPEITRALRPYLDIFKIDLKCFSDKQYRNLGGVLDRVLDTIRLAWELGYWVEIVTLLVPGFNNEPGELRDMARFIRSVSPDIPWHVTAFHRDYRRDKGEDSTARQLIEAAETGVGEGLHYVYAGNLPGEAGKFENTYCPACKKLLVRRSGFSVQEQRVTPGGQCPDCGARIAGIWS